jgi:N-acyl-D-amino-acid deacylase
MLRKSAYCAARLVIVFSVAACASVGSRTNAAAPYDVLITNATIVDGTGNPWYRGSVATIGDRIAYVGPALSTLQAKRVIDAHEQVVSPGFIDMLGHSEDVILTRPQAVSKVTQGITSEITGEVSSAWPNTVFGRPADPRDPKSLGEFFDSLDRKGAAINLGTYVGTSSVREAVMGNLERHPTSAEIAQMGALIDSAMRDGAVGLGTGLIYLPSSFFTTDELIALTKYVTPYKGGYAAHMRHEDDRQIEAIQETIRIAKEAGTWAEIRHIKNRSPEVMRQSIALIDSARAAGIDITADQYPYIASGTNLASLLNEWIQVGGSDSLVARLHDPEMRARAKREMQEDSARGIRTAEEVMVSSVRADSLKKYEGKRLTEIGAMRGTDGWDAALDLLMLDRGRPSRISFSFNEEALRMAMQQPWASVGQDAGARSPDSTGSFGVGGHPRAFGTFTRILGRYVREQKLISLEFAIRKMTSLAAQRVGIEDRGLLRPGMFADIVVFDPNSVVDNATYQQPTQLSTGVNYVMVNGVFTLDGGKVTGALPGRALRGRGARKYH